MRAASLLSSSSLSLPPNSYIYKILPIHQLAALAAISSDDSLRIFDPETLQLVNGGVRTEVHDGVTCAELGGVDQQLIMTAGRDAAIRGWDLRSGKKTFEVNDGGFGFGAVRMIIMWLINGFY